MLIINIWAINDTCVDQIGSLPLGSHWLKLAAVVEVILSLSLSLSFSLSYTHTLSYFMGIPISLSHTRLISISLSLTHTQTKHTHSFLHRSVDGPKTKNSLWRSFRYFGAWDWLRTNERSLRKTPPTPKKMLCSKHMDNKSYAIQFLLVPRKTKCVGKSGISNLAQVYQSCKEAKTKSSLKIAKKQSKVVL